MSKTRKINGIVFETNTIRKQLLWQHQLKFHVIFGNDLPYFRVYGNLYGVFFEVQAFRRFEQRDKKRRTKINNRQLCTILSELE